MMNQDTADIATSFIASGLKNSGLYVILKRGLQPNGLSQVLVQEKAVAQQIIDVLLIDNKATRRRPSKHLLENSINDNWTKGIWTAYIIHLDDETFLVCSGEEGIITLRTGLEQWVMKTQGQIAYSHEDGEAGTLMRIYENPNRARNGTTYLTQTTVTKGPFALDLKDPNGVARLVQA